MQFLCDCMKIDCEIDCDARGRRLRFCLGHQITQSRDCCIGPFSDSFSRDRLNKGNEKQTVSFSGDNLEYLKDILDMFSN